MYTAGPTKAELPKKEYAEQTMRIIVFFQFGHYVGLSNLFVSLCQCIDILEADHLDLQLGLGRALDRRTYHLPLYEFSA
jgi:hypothetical protein